MMADEPEFRIGDAPSGLGRAIPKTAAAPGLDRESYPTLAAFLKVPPPEFRTRVDRLVARARTEASPDVQGALQAAVRVLPEIYKAYGG